MPELPEVEVCRQGVLPGVQGQLVRDVILRAPSLRRPLTQDLVDGLCGARIRDVRRRGKYLLFECTRAGGLSGVLLVHLGMTGVLRLVPPDTPVARHEHVDIVFERIVLRYSDPRRFGLMLWHAGGQVEQHPLLRHLGVEPLERIFDGAWLQQALLGRRAPIKPVLMDASLIVGVGNIYAAESLFMAGISPLRTAASLLAGECDRLADSIRQTLSGAIAAGGSSIRNYLHSDGQKGYFQITVAVYGRAGAPCRQCGAPVQMVRQAGRSTFYCGYCQV